MRFDDESPLTFIIDRGIFKIALFSELRDKFNVHIVTWEKGYQKGEWQEEQQRGEFILRQIIVKATHPRNRTIEVSILASDQERSAIWIITAMFHRWLQENDFKYLDTHFGINEITSNWSHFVSSMTTTVMIT